MIIVKEIIKHRKNQIKSIIEELKLTKKGIKNDIKEIFLSRTMLLPFVQYMQIRELNAQERNENIKLKFKINSNKVRNLRENMLVQENLIEKMEAKKEVERFNDYLISFKKSLESRARNMKIERLKMKINDVQMNLEKEMKNKDIMNVRRKVNFCGFYRFDENKISENKSSYKNKKSKRNSSKSDKISKKSKSISSKGNKNKEKKKDDESDN